MAAVHDYIQSLAPLPLEQAGETKGPIVKRPGITKVDGVDLEVSEQRIRLVQQVADFTEISPVPDTLWAGCAITGLSVGPGALAPIALSRHSGTLTVTTDLRTNEGRSRSRPLPTPNLASYVDVLNGLIADLKPTDSAAAASLMNTKINTLEEGFVRLEINVKGIAFGMDAKARLDTRLERSTTLGRFSQVYYQVAFSPDGSPPQFFKDDVSVDQIKEYAGPDNPPCYIASVSYGRMLLFLVDSEASTLEVRAALNGYWSAATSGSADIEGQYKNAMARSSVTALLIGGSSGSTGQVLQDPVKHLLAWIKDELKITRDVPASPIQYTVRYMAAPHNLVRVSRTTDPIKIVDANIYGGREHLGEFKVGEGPGRGPVKTGIRLKKGDTFIVTATGMIWSGWKFLPTNGPAGLAGPAKDYYPLPNVAGSSLLAGWNNGNWFYVGEGGATTVDAQFDDAELWFRLNDDNMENGNGDFTVNVSVKRRMPILNAIG